MKTTNSAPEFGHASLLLHHLLNQSLSALDFCILWQEHCAKHPSLGEVQSLVQQFLDKACLVSLDKALALVGEPEGEALPSIDVRPPDVSGTWQVKSTRIRDVSRAEFRCRDCGWEITLSQEHEANTEMRLPFDNMTCPYCDHDLLA